MGNNLAFYRWGIIWLSKDGEEYGYLYLGYNLPMMRDSETTVLYLIWRRTNNYVIEELKRNFKRVYLHPMKITLRISVAEKTRILQVTSHLVHDKCQKLKFLLQCFLMQSQTMIHGNSMSHTILNTAGITNTSMILKTSKNFLVSNCLIYFYF